MIKHNHAELLRQVRHDLPTDDLLMDVSDLFKLFGDMTRAKILFSLAETEMCVYAISELLGMTQSAISHQLKVLRDANLVGTRRDGKEVIYFLQDEHVRSILAQGFEHLLEKQETKTPKKKGSPK